MTAPQILAFALAGCALLAADPKALGSWALRAVAGAKNKIFPAAPGPANDPAMVQVAELVNLYRAMKARQAEAEAKVLLEQIFPKLFAEPEAPLKLTLPPGAVWVQPTDFKGS